MALFKLGMPADQAAFFFEEPVQPRQRANVGLDLSGVGGDRPDVESASREMPADLVAFFLGHRLYDFRQPGGDLVDRFCLRVFINPLLQLGAGEICLPNPLAIFDHVVGHRVCLLELAATATGEFNVRMLGQEDGGRVLGNRCEIEFIDSH